MASYPRKIRVGRFFIIFNIFKNLFIEPVENAVSLLYQGLQRFFLRFSCEKFATDCEKFVTDCEKFATDCEKFATQSTGGNEGSLLQVREKKFTLFICCAIIIFFSYL